MNLPALFRRALHVLFPARSPQQTTEPTRGVAAVPEPAPRPDLEDKTARIPVEKYRAAVRDRIDQFPPRPAAPSGPRPRGEAEVVRPREVPDNSAPDRWTP